MSHTPPNICPGWHNDRYRLAIADNPAADMWPVYGDPQWCAGCLETTRARIAYTPHAAANLAVEIRDATRPAAERVSGSRERRLHDAQPYTVALDDLHDLLTQWEDDIRSRRGLAARRTDVRRETATIAASRFVINHLEWALQRDPDAAVVEGAARLFVDRLHRLDRRIMRLTHQQEPEEEPCEGVACRDCDYMTLVWSLVTDGSKAHGARSGAVRCLECGAQMTAEQYQTWVGQLAAYERARSRAAVAA